MFPVVGLLAGLVALIAAAAAVTLYRQREPLFAWDGTTFMRSVYTTNPFPEAVEVADYLREHGAPGERIAVLGSEPEIYFRRDGAAAVRARARRERPPGAPAASEFVTSGAG
jgi:hypothetical protein